MGRRGRAEATASGPWGRSEGHLERPAPEPALWQRQEPSGSPESKPGPSPVSPLRGGAGVKEASQTLRTRSFRTTAPNV